MLSAKSTSCKEEKEKKYRKVTKRVAFGSAEGKDFLKEARE
jgi:hypothetical protein